MAAQQQHQRQRRHHMPIGADNERDELATLAARPVFGCKIGAHGMEAQRHCHRNQIHGGDDEQVFPEQFRPPNASDQRLRQKDEAGADQPRAENDARLRGKAAVDAHWPASPLPGFAWVGRVFGLRHASRVRRNA